MMALGLGEGSSEEEKYSFAGLFGRPGVGASDQDHTLFSES